MKKAYIRPNADVLSMSMESVIAESGYEVDAKKNTLYNWTREKGYASGWNSELWASMDEE